MANTVKERDVKKARELINKALGWYGVPYTAKEDLKQALKILTVKPTK